MRLLLDAHLSGKKIAPVLREWGHDVVAAVEVRDLARLPDAELFEVAAQEGRIMVTSNVKHFFPLLRDWGTAGRSHSGCIVISSNVRQEHFGDILAGLNVALSAIPDQQDWQDRTYWLSRGSQ